MSQEAPLPSACVRPCATPARKSNPFARRCIPMRTRRAILPDAEHIHDLISGYSHDGTLLPPTLAEICENVRDFVVLEDDGHIIGCGALHLYGTHLAEIRSITESLWHAPCGDSLHYRRALGAGQGWRRPLDEVAHGRGQATSRRLHLPLYAQARLLCRSGILGRAARGYPRQDLQRLPRLPALPLLRRSGHGPR